MCALREVVGLGGGSARARARMPPAAHLSTAFLTRAQTGGRSRYRPQVVHGCFRAGVSFTPLLPPYLYRSAPVLRCDWLNDGHT